MGRAVQLTALRESIRQRYDLDPFSSGTFVTLTAVDAMINASLQAFYAMLMEAFGDDYFTTTTTLTALASTATLALPADLVKLKRLDWLKTAGEETVEVERARPDDHMRAQIEERWVSPRYALEMTTVRWFPVPDQNETVYCRYVQIPADLSLDTDTFQAGPGWEEWAVLDVCRKIAEREEEDTAQWLAQRADAEQRIRIQAPDRNETNAAQIRDARKLVRGQHELRDVLTLRWWR